MAIDKIKPIGNDEDKSIYFCDNCKSRSFKLIKYEFSDTIYLECANCEHLHLNFSIQEKKRSWV